MFDPFHINCLRCPVCGRAKLVQKNTSWGYGRYLLEYLSQHPAAYMCEGHGDYFCLFLCNMKTASCQPGELGPGHRRTCGEKGIVCTVYVCVYDKDLSLCVWLLSLHCTLSLCCKVRSCV